MLYGNNPLEMDCSFCLVHRRHGGARHKKATFVSGFSFLIDQLICPNNSLKWASSVLKSRH